MFNIDINNISNKRRLIKLDDLPLGEIFMILDSTSNAIYLNTRKYGDGNGSSTKEFNLITNEYDSINSKANVIVCDIEATVEYAKIERGSEDD